MSAHSTAIGVSPKRGTWGGGNEPLKASYGKLMMWFFLLSDIFTFAAFFDQLLGYSRQLSCLRRTCRDIRWIQ